MLLFVTGKDDIARFDSRRYNNTVIRQKFQPNSKYSTIIIIFNTTVSSKYVCPLLRKIYSGKYKAKV
jgi:hypothetical protein